MTKHKQSRPVRVNRIAKKLAARTEKRRASKPEVWGSKPLRRKNFRMRRHVMVAYDLETTRIKAGETPRCKYITAYGPRGDEAAKMRVSERITNPQHLLDILKLHLLIPEYNGARFVAWNGNNFDVYLIAQALLGVDDYIMRPYLTRSKGLRGLRIILKKPWEDVNGKERKLSWEFLDGISMTGLVGTPLKSRYDKHSKKDIKGFLAQFAPEYDYKIGPDFDKEEFDADNPEHRKYAERDSEGLYKAMIAVEQIIVDNFNGALQPTIGNLGIKLFQMNMPLDVTVWKPPFACLDALRNQVLRGGYCWRAQRYEGPLWKYDINQAYAAAMRDAEMPAGKCYWNASGVWRKAGRRVVNPHGKPFIIRVRGKHRRNKVPFYCRNMEGEPVFATTEIPETWITSNEYEQLLSEGAELEAAESYFWDAGFTMQDFVNRLEQLRRDSPGGPSGPQGIVVKQLGNNSYGKTVERLDGIELVMALNCPDGYNHYQSENDQLQCVWYKFAEPVMREYHQPQLGAFITAHVRMKVRKVVLLSPESWVYADTDCAAFTQAVSLHTDPVKYGHWKIEEAGTREYYVIEKKVYASKDGKVRKAKGLNVRNLTMQDFEKWYDGKPPRQTQVQRNNFVTFMTGGEMFKSLRKVGQRVEGTK